MSVSEPSAPPREAESPETQARLSLQRHFPELDGVRGVAIALILLYHTFPSYALPGAGRWVNGIVGSMWVGVDLFFVLSGFLITRILLASKNAPGALRTFYARRSLRIFPLYFFALTLFLWVVPLFAPSPVRDGMFGLQPLAPWFYGYAFNIWILLHSAWPSSDLLNDFWSLAVEEQFYLFWPFVIFFCDRRRLPVIALSAVALAVALKVGLAASGVSWPVLYTSLFTRMDAFALGALAAYAFVYAPGARADLVARRAFWTSGGLLLLLLLALRGFSVGSRLSQVLVTPLTAVFFGAGLYRLLQSQGQSRAAMVLRAPALRFFGKYSYGLYIYHWVLHRLMVRSTGFEAVQETVWGPFLAFFATNLLAILIAMASFHLFEAQFLKLRPRNRAA